ncbi:hypothetical protein M0R45_028683 [Rubus argutus]|uniref:Uncharacterized protein n=1 Tax=Rubus argutus TaxID=59490 RepID=A0AAW1W612_RUBAR
MKKGNRRSKQTAEASTADDYEKREKRVRELEIENKAFQVTRSIFSFSFEFGDSVSFGVRVMVERGRKKEDGYGGEGKEERRRRLLSVEAGPTGFAAPSAGGGNNRR